MIDVELSRRVVRELGLRPQNKRCFHNAMRALRHDALDGGRYVEGFGDGLPHGWAETRDGRIVEVTPVWLDKSPAAIYEPVRKFAPADLVGVASLPVTDLDALLADRCERRVPPLTAEQEARQAEVRAAWMARRRMERRAR